LRYLFDLTTAAHWTGPVVGIVRVERELARRARKLLGDQLVFCLYDRFRNLFLAIDDGVAEEIIHGRLQVDLTPQNPTKPRNKVSRQVNAVRRRLRRALLAHAAPYQLFQRLRGRSFTREEILQIQALEFSGDQRKLKPVPVASLPHRPAELDAKTSIISGGLDWQYKDLRAIWALKQLHKFRYCAVVYDLIPVFYPQFVVPGYSEFLTEYFGELLWLADYVMCDSQVTQADWLRHAHHIGAVPAPSHVFPLGCDLPVDAPDKAPGELPHDLRGKRFALYVSTIEPRKNHRVLYEAWDECLRTKQVDPAKDRLVFVGRRGWATDDLLHEMETNSLTSDTIIILHDVSDDLLKLLNQECSFVVFPSHFEGFGLAVAEALACGKPCVTSNSSSLLEIGADLVMRLDPIDTLGWARTVARLMSSPSELQSLAKRVKAEYRPTTWDDSARHFFDGITSNNMLRARAETSRHQ
jgi:glycosyltransferase involved in cell wall biosynthesis